jgi:predicted anti-sigma-YlaC factor YlaD
MAHPTEEQLNEYLDDVLLNGERARVEAHVAQCGACRAELASMQAVFVALDGLQSEPVARDLGPAVVYAVVVERRRAARRRRLGRAALALQGVAVALLLASGWSMLVARYQGSIQWVSAESLRTTWKSVTARWHVLWTAVVVGWHVWWTEVLAELQELPAALGQWTRGLLRLPVPFFPIYCVVILGLAAALMWVVGNTILLRANGVHLKPGRHANH